MGYLEKNLPDCEKNKCKGPAVSSLAVMFISVKSTKVGRDNQRTRVGGNKSKE